MAPDIDKVGSDLPSALANTQRFKSQQVACFGFQNQVMVGEKYSHDNLKYQISLIQMEMLAQKLDDLACDQIASELLRDTNAVAAEAMAVMALALPISGAVRRISSARLANHRCRLAAHRYPLTRRTYS